MTLASKALGMGVVGVALASLASGCGWYTNIPAAIVAVGVTPGRVLYEKKSNEVITTITNPKVTFRADPGSVGATFDLIDVTYVRNDGRTKTDAALLPAMVLGATVRVDGSVYPDNPLAAGPLDQTKVGTNVFVGRFEYEIPVITRHVEAYGSRSSGNEANANAIYAQCIFRGADDANWPIEATVIAPIVFNGTPPNP